MWLQKVVEGLSTHTHTLTDPGMGAFRKQLSKAC